MKCDDAGEKLKKPNENKMLVIKLIDYVPNFKSLKNMRFLN
jgi:hypothetical protein